MFIGTFGVCCEDFLMQVIYGMEMRNKFLEDEFHRFFFSLYCAFLCYFFCTLARLCLEESFWR